MLTHNPRVLVGFRYGVCVVRHLIVVSDAAAS